MEINRESLTKLRELRTMQLSAREARNVLRAGGFIGRLAVESDDVLLIEPHRAKEAQRILHRAGIATGLGQFVDDPE